MKSTVLTHNAERWLRRLGHFESETKAIEWGTNFCLIQIRATKEKTSFKYEGTTGFSVYETGKPEDRREFRIVGDEVVETTAGKSLASFHTAQVMKERGVSFIQSECDRRSKSKLDQYIHEQLTRLDNE